MNDCSGGLIEVVKVRLNSLSSFHQALRMRLISAVISGY